MLLVLIKIRQVKIKKPLKIAILDFLPVVSLSYIHDYLNNLGAWYKELNASFFKSESGSEPK